MDLFDSPLGMALSPAKRILLAGTDSYGALSLAIEKFRLSHQNIREWKPLPF